MAFEAGWNFSAKGMPFPSTFELLMEGGDGRIVCGTNGLNRYGCAVHPDPDVLAFGSSTASTISTESFTAANALRDRIELACLLEDQATVYSREADRLRSELVALCDLEELRGLEIVLGASGTDLHLFASQLTVSEGARAPMIIRVEASETGTGVPDALAGLHFSNLAALGDTVSSGARLDCGQPIETVEVNCRTREGTLRPAAEIDSAVEKATVGAALEGRRVLITLVDVSKTGLLAPSPTCALALQRRFPNLVEVLVDACQFRLASSTLKRYLEHDFMVAITGSKFVTGPTFCGALLVPQAASRCLRTCRLPTALKSYSTQADWPQGWAARESLRPSANFGLLLRWEAALTELRTFRRLPESAVHRFLKSFQKAISHRLANDPTFEPLPTPALDRGPIFAKPTWDQTPTIFPFLLRRSFESGKHSWLSQPETKRVHELLRAGGSPDLPLSLRCQLGQPVACGMRESVPVSALRLCVSSRLIVNALSPTGIGAEAVIAKALAVLDNTAQLAQLPLV